jgi:hypothetical protein
MEYHKALIHQAVHKRSGWSKGLNTKQFDVSRRNYCKHFYSHKSIADIISLPHICWGFGHQKKTITNSNSENKKKRRTEKKWNPYKT